MRCDLIRAVLVASACIKKCDSDQGSPLRRHYRNQDMRGAVSFTSKPTPSLPRITRGTRSHAAEELLTERGQKFLHVKIFCEDWSNLWRRIWKIWGPSPYIGLPLSRAETSDEIPGLFSTLPSCNYWPPLPTVSHGRWYSSCGLNDFRPTLSHPLVCCFLSTCVQPETSVSWKISATCPIMNACWWRY